MQEDLYFYRFYTLCIHLKCLEGLKARLLDEAKSIVIYQKDVPPGSDPPLIDSQALDEPDLMDSTLQILVDPNHLSKLYVTLRKLFGGKTFKLVVTTACKHHVD